MEEIVAQEYAHWSIVRPGRLTNGPLTGRVRVLPSLEPGMKVGSISREDVAGCLLTMAETRRWERQYPAITG